MVPMITGDRVLLPRDSLKWIESHSEEVLSAHVAQGETLDPKYSFSPTTLFKNIHHEQIIRRNLTKELPILMIGMMDEVMTTVDRAFGIDNLAWREVPVLESILQIVARVSSRVFVGPDLCKINPKSFYSMLQLILLSN